MEIYDYVEASTIEVDDQVWHENDQIEVTEVIDSVTAIMVKGYSYITGDNACYILTPDTKVGLWTV